MKKIAQALSLIALLFTQLAIASEDANKTQSPYFHVNSTDPKNDRLPLIHTEADVKIAGAIADVTVRQVYINEGQNPLEAVYVFPGSTRAAVYGMDMKVGDRTIVAKIHKKGEARKVYDEALLAGKTASLLEQHRPNVFQMNVANIMPGDTIVVSLKYTELLVPEEGVYEFVYPTVVGPRYTSSAEMADSTNEAWANNPYQEAGEKPTYTYGMNVSIKAGMPLQEVICKSHHINYKKRSEQTMELKLDEMEKYGGNRDFILSYSLKGEEIQSGILVYEGEKENYFLAMIQPPKRVQPEHIPNREYIFIMDVSGSMSGFPTQVSKTLIHDLLSSLKRNELFNVMFFAGGNSVMFKESVPATSKNIRKATKLVSGQYAGGGTELIAALEKAFALPENQGYSKSLVIATDGYVSVEKEAFDLVKRNLGKSNFFPFGIGSGVNRHLIEGMADVGKGEAFVANDSETAKEVAAKFRKYIESPVLTDISVDYEGIQAYDYDTIIADVFAERPIMVMGKFKGKPEGKMILKGISGNGQEYIAELDFSKANNSKENAGLRYLWARNKIKDLGDYAGRSISGDAVEEITQLGLEYTLLTDYTSFVAVGEEVRNPYDASEKVVQPLSMPQGVTIASTPGVSVTTSTMACVVVSAGKYESVVSDLACSVSVINPKRSGYAVAYLRGVEIRADNAEWTSTYDWEAHERRKQERKAKRKANLEYKTIPDMDNSTVDKKPYFVGGDTAMHEFIQNTLRYPTQAKADSIQGVVKVSFVVGADGTLSFFKVEKSVSKELDAEALRVAQAMPRWIPGLILRRASKVKVTIPIEFKLE